MIDISSYHPQRKLLANKVILITGSTSGIGREASITFSQFGAKTILLGKNIELLEETYELIVSNNLEKPILHVLDFDQAKEEEYFQLAESVLQEYGKLDGLLNNAGIVYLSPCFSHLAITFGFSTFFNISSGLYTFLYSSI